MNITFGPKGILHIDDARIIYRNFSGAPSKFNREGDRNFAVIVDDEEIKDALVENGWNVKIKPPREEGDDPFMYLPVKVKYNDYGPNVYLVTSGRPNKLDEDTVGILDEIDILNVDLDIKGSVWEMNGKTGTAAYLRNMEVVQELDRFAERYAARRSAEMEYDDAH